jgi:hypothetical protein
MSPLRFRRYDRAALASRSSRAPRAPERRRITPTCALCPFPRYHGTVDRVNLASLSPPASPTGSFAPVGTITTLSGVAVECARAHCGQGTDLRGSRLAPVSAKIVRGRPLGLPRGIHRVLFPHVAVRAPPVPIFDNQGVVTTRVDTRAARKPWRTSCPVPTYTSHQRLFAIGRYYAGKGPYTAIRVAGAQMPPSAETMSQGHGAGGVGSSFSGRYEQPPPGRSGSARRAIYTPMHEFPGRKGAVGALFRRNSHIAGSLPPRKGIACKSVVTEARAPAGAAFEAMMGSRSPRRARGWGTPTTADVVALSVTGSVPRAATLS